MRGGKSGSREISMSVLLLDGLCRMEFILLAECRMGQMRGNCGKKTKAENVLVIQMKKNKDVT